jgi:sugar/nucleoside kinase (ribokinase family)
MVTPIINEIEADALESLNSGLLALDPQGFTRSRRSNGAIEFKHWWDPRLLRKLTLLKASQSELQLITGEEDPWKALLKLEDAGVEIAVATMGEQGALMLHGGKRIRVPAYPRTRMIDSTGAGDCFLAGMMSALAAGDTSDWAAALGSAAASLIIETHGPALSSTRSILQERADEIHDLMLLG